jgi:hypothetical protein
MLAKALEKVQHQTRLLNRYAEAFQQVLHKVFGVPFTCFDAAKGEQVATADNSGHRSVELDARRVIHLAAAGQAVVVPHGSTHFGICLVLHAAGKPLLVAAGTVPALTATVTSRAQEQVRLQSWAEDFSERLRLGDELSARIKTEEDLRGQLNAAWTVNLTLGQCMQRLHFNRDRLRDQQRILKGALRLLNAQAIVWDSKQPDHAPVIAGDAPLTAEDVETLVQNLSTSLHNKGSE